MPTLPTAAVQDISVLQNTTWQYTFVFNDVSGSPIDISTLSFTGSIREFADAPGSPVAVFGFSLIDPTKLLVTLYPTQSANLTNTRYYYDIIAVDNLLIPPTVTRLVQGKVNVGLGVTTL